MLEIKVVRPWLNHLIGDAALPPEQHLTNTNVFKPVNYIDINNKLITRNFKLLFLIDKKAWSTVEYLGNCMLSWV